MTMPEITDETYMLCPRCDFDVCVSPEDPDSSLSDMHRHLRSRHPDRNADQDLARVSLVYR